MKNAKDFWIENLKQNHELKNNLKAEDVLKRWKATRLDTIRTTLNLKAKATRFVLALIACQYAMT